MAEQTYEEARQTLLDMGVSEEVMQQFEAVLRSGLPKKRTNQFPFSQHFTTAQSAADTYQKLALLLYHLSMVQKVAKDVSAEFSLFQMLYDSTSPLDKTVAEHAVESLRKLTTDDSHVWIDSLMRMMLEVLIGDRDALSPEQIASLSKE